MQLVAYGAQDIYLTGNPQITFFKVVYRRHTNFSIECIEQTFNGTADFGRTVTCNISRNGDLVTKMYLKVILAETDDVGWKYGFVKNLGRVLIESVKVEIGGSKIDEHYGDWLNIWSELSRNKNHDVGTNKMIGNVPELRKKTDGKEQYTLYVPMQFWFCRNNGLALPLIALQYHDVRVTFKFRDVSECIYMQMGGSGTRNNVKFKDATLLIDYIYLDSEERKRFAQVSHEYLIEQLQFTGEESVNSVKEKFRLDFNHPCKALYWSIRLGKYTTGKSSIALNDDGEIDIEKFAKVLYMVTRVNDEANIGSYANHGYTYTITGGTSENEIVNPPQASVGTNPVENNISLIVKKLVDKIIEARFVIAGTHTPIVLSLKNVVIVKHTLTIADISSITHDTLEEGITGVGAKKMLNRYANILRLHSNYGLYIDGTANPVQYAKLQLNGHDRFSEKDGHYFNYVQPTQYFSNTPSDGINVYSFALNPEEHQPSGSCNMSRIDNAILSLTLGERNAVASGSFATDYLVDDTVCSIYTVNYNVLRIMSGMGGLAYSN